jgi:hypothetical protein
MRALAGLLLAVLPAFGQWLGYPAKGIPRLPDGTPDLKAPAPKMPDGRPDLSGFWRTDPSRRDPLQGAEGDKDVPFQPWAKAESERRRANQGKDAPDSRCLPHGAARAGIPGGGSKIVQTPMLMVILYEDWTYFRQVFLDGRALPKDPAPAWLGYSAGRWEGDALVIQTNGNRAENWLPGLRPATEALYITERYQRTDFGHLQRRYTIDDPGAYTKPWSYSADAYLRPDDELIENICIENERDVRHLVGK